MFELPKDATFDQALVITGGFHHPFNRVLTKQIWPKKQKNNKITRD